MYKDIICDIEFKLKVSREVERIILILGIHSSKEGIVIRKTRYLVFCILFSTAILADVCNQVRVHRKNN